MHVDAPSIGIRTFFRRRPPLSRSTKPRSPSRRNRLIMRPCRSTLRWTETSSQRVSALCGVGGEDDKVARPVVEIFENAGARVARGDAGARHSEIESLSQWS